MLELSAARRSAAASLLVAAMVGQVVTAGAQPYVLPLLPAAPLSRQAYLNSSLWSWGGNAIQDPDDASVWHLHVAAFVNNCNLGEWSSNSLIIHATGPSALGPFQFVDVAAPVWHHNPQVVRYTDGTWLMYVIGMDPEGHVANCTREHVEAQLQRGEQLDASPRLLRGGLQGPTPLGHGAELVQIYSSASLNGPWSLAQPVSPTGWPSNIFNGTNPSPFVQPNGTVVVASHDGGGLTISTAPHYRGPYSPPVRVLNFTVSSNGITFEDPFLWYDAPAGKWRVLLHQYNSSDPSKQFDVGGYAETAGQSAYGPWTLQGPSTPAFTTFAQLSDGTNVTFSRRERPKLLFNATTGAPAVLYTGVCPQPHGNGDCFTFAQPIQQQ